MSIEKAKSIYGENLPELVEERLERAKFHYKQWFCGYVYYCSASCKINF